MNGKMVLVIETNLCTSYRNIECGIIERETPACIYVRVFTDAGHAFTMRFSRQSGREMGSTGAYRYRRIIAGEYLIAAFATVEKAYREIRQMNEEVVFKIGLRKITRQQAKAAFARVSDDDNWKNPIRATIRGCSRFELKVIERAVQFYTGSVLKIHSVKYYANRQFGIDEAVVSADGYYVAVGA